MDIGQIVIVLIALIITITIGTIIMSNVSSGLDCSSLTPASETYPRDAKNATGWQKLCYGTQTQGISAVNLLLIALIIIAAAAIIATVRMIGY